MKDILHDLSTRYQQRQDSRLYLSLANHYIVNDMIDEALDLLNRHLKPYSKDPIAYVLLSKIFEIKDDIDKAKETLQTACDIFPNHSYLHKRLAEINCLLLTAEKMSQVDAIHQSLDNMIAEAHEYLIKGAIDEAMKIYDMINDRYPGLKSLIAKKMELAHQYLPENREKIVMTLQKFLSAIKQNFANITIQNNTDEIVTKLKSLLSAIKAGFAPTPNDVVDRLNLFYTQIRFHFARL